jgi:molybdopterin synthase catalytic subunit
MTEPCQFKAGAVEPDCGPRGSGGYPGTVNVVVRLFAGLREQAGTRERRLELADGALVGDVWGALGLGDEPEGLLFAVNRAYASREERLADGDEVAVIPPVSGGAFRLSEEPLALEDAVREVAADEAGAIATFVGTTRAHSRGREVVRLEYEAYEGMAEAEMERIAHELRERYALVDVAIHHRIGVVEVGQPSVVIAVSSAHRADALAACRDAIDTLKVSVPLWKKEVYVGGEEWIGQGS